MRRPTGHLLFVLVVCLAAAPARAALIGLDLQNAPDIASGFIDVQYNATSNVLSAMGFALTYDDDGISPVENIFGGSFQIAAVVNESGIATGGSLTVGGNVAGVGPSLLSGSLVDFGFVDGGGDLLEFVFQVMGGDLAAVYGGVGSTVGVIMDINGQGYSGNWTQSFNNRISGIPGTGNGVANVAPLPTPGTIALLALAGLCGARRRRA